MAALTTMAQAEELVRTRMESGAWVQGHSARNPGGSVIVRFQRFMSPSTPDEGGWVESAEDDAL